MSGIRPRLDLAVHGLVAIAWMSLAMGIALKIALLGNEQAALAKERGADFKSRSDLAYTRDRLASVLDLQTSPSILGLVMQGVPQLARPASPATPPPSGAEGLASAHHPTAFP